MNSYPTGCVVVEFISYKVTKKLRLDDNIPCPRACYAALQDPREVHRDLPDDVRDGALRIRAALPAGPAAGLLSGDSVPQYATGNRADRIQKSLNLDAADKNPRLF